LIVALRNPEGTVHTQTGPEHHVEAGDVLLPLYGREEPPRFQVRAENSREIIDRGARSGGS